MRPWAIAGFSGSGKSTVGPRVAAAAGRAFADLDETIGHDRVLALLARAQDLREAEADALEALAAASPAVVVALGGGALDGERTRRVLAAGWRVAWLDAPLETCVARCEEHAQERPVLAAALRRGRHAAERLHAERRAEGLRVADAVVDATGAPDGVARDVLQALERLG